MPVVSEREVKRGRCVALVPAKGTSRRVPRKNLAPFWGGLSLLEIKVRVLRQCELVDEIVVSSEDPEALEMAARLGATPHLRSERLCHDHIVLRELFEEVLGAYRRDLVYWAHPTSPFVQPASIDAALTLARAHPASCVLGVERLQEFLWDSGGPLNYEVGQQPRSQDLPPLWRVTGGIHMARGAVFIERGAVSFQPVRFFELEGPEALDIDTPSQWDHCHVLADAVLGDLLAGSGAVGGQVRERAAAGSEGDIALQS